ncbi:hypothetical protein [Roseomonas gilardii]|nr:hypothetical protein [Roseomonas gilardii]
MSGGKPPRSHTWFQAASGWLLLYVTLGNLLGVLLQLLFIDNSACPSRSYLFDPSIIRCSGMEEFSLPLLLILLPPRLLAIIAAFPIAVIPLNIAENDGFNLTINLLFGAATFVIFRAASFRWPLRPLSYQSLLLPLATITLLAWAFLVALEVHMHH